MCPGGGPISIELSLYNKFDNDQQVYRSLGDVHPLSPTSRTAWHSELLPLLPQVRIQSHPRTQGSSRAILIKLQEQTPALEG
jgi:hypothetical protein